MAVSIACSISLFFHGTFEPVAFSLDADGAKWCELYGDLNQESKGCNSSSSSISGPGLIALCWNPVWMIFDMFGALRICILYRH